MPPNVTFWWQHVRVPLTVFVPVAGLLATTPLDTALAHVLFFDASHLRWIGAESWWTNEFLHTGGRWAIRVVALAAGVFWIATFKFTHLRLYRRPSGYFFVAVVLCAGIVGLLKTVTNVHCPWDLAEFGGQFPYRHLFAPRPDGFEPGKCFPAAHSSSGYALIALYFALRERSKSLARVGLALGIVTGLIFGIAQQSRGAHFLSHDVWSGFLVWLISLTLYALVFEGQLWQPQEDRNNVSIAVPGL